MSSQLKTFAVLLLINVLCGCGHSSTSTKTPATDPDSHHWTTTVPIHSYEWRVNGKNIGGGSQAELSDQLQFRVVRESNQFHWSLAIGSKSGSGSDSLHVDPANVAKLTLPPDGILAINGPTPLLQLEERDPNGQLIKTTELFVQ